MPFIAAIDTYLPHWGCDVRRNAGGVEDAITFAAQADTDVAQADTNVAEVHPGSSSSAMKISASPVDSRPTNLFEAEVTTGGGVLPVNPSGGLNAKGHPPGATGFAQCVDLFGHLRGKATNRVDVVRVGVAHNLGGRTAVSAVTILEGPANGK